MDHNLPNPLQMLRTTKEKWIEELRSVREQNRFPVEPPGVHQCLIDGLLFIGSPWRFRLLLIVSGIKTGSPSTQVIRQVTGCSCKNPKRKSGYIIFRIHPWLLF